MADSTAALTTAEEIEASRQKRLERIKAMRRDRGGIFKPAESNPLIDILMSRDVSGKSPEKPKPRRSEAHDPQGRQKKKKPSEATPQSNDAGDKSGESSKGTKKGTTRKPRNTSKKAAAAGVKSGKDISEDEEDAKDVAKSKKGKEKETAATSNRAPKSSRVKKRCEEENEAADPSEHQSEKNPRTKSTNKKEAESKGRSSTNRGQTTKKTKPKPKEPPETSHVPPSSSQLKTIPEEHEPSDPEPLYSRASRADSSNASQKKRKEAEFMNEASSSKEGVNKKRRPKPDEEKPEPATTQEKRCKPRLVDKPRKPAAIDAKIPPNAQAGPNARRVFSSPPKLSSVKWRNPLEDAKLGFVPRLMGSPLKEDHGEDELDIL